MSKQNSPKAPVAKQEPYQQTIHGRVLTDEYAWLKNRGDREVVAYLEAENEYSRSVLAPTEKLQEDIYQEMLARIKETDLSVPVRHGDYYYYSRTEKGKQYSIYCRKKESLDADEEIILDMNFLAEGFDYFSLGALEISPNHRFLAYSTDTSGDETYTLQFKDLSTGKIFDDRVHGVSSGGEWAQDNRTFFYVTQDEAKRPFKLFRHELGSSEKDDKEIFHEKDETFFLGIYKTRDERFLILDLGSKVTSEQYFLDASNPAGEFRVIQPRRRNIEYSAEHHDGRFLIVTNDEAKNFRLMTAPQTSPSREHWEEVIPHKEDVKIDDIDVFRDFLVVYVRENGLTRIQIRNFSEKEYHWIDFEEPVYTAWAGNNPEFDTKTLRFGYSSLITPSSVFDYDMQSKKRELKKQQEVLGGYDPSLYASERLLVQAKDGTSIPVSMVYRKGLQRNGRNPFFLYGYGAYGICMDPVFSSNRLSLLDRGFVFAIAHIRGGGEMGRPWYEAGKLMNKENSFSDFIACAEKMIGEKYTSPERLIIGGGSAGGLLMGAVLNARPELFHGAIMHVPFVDVINTMLDPTLPLTVTEYDEWGNPEEKDAFECIYAYSPYDHIREQRYPHMLITGGLNDPRVQYWEPAKWAARVRAKRTDNNYVLLKMHMGAGHGGPSGRYEYLREIALDYAFMLFILDRIE